MQCDLCGKDEKLFKALIEDTEMNVCEECAKFGKVLAPVRTKEFKNAPVKKAMPEEPERIVLLMDGYPEIIKRAREKKGLTQKQLARALAEKESLIHNLESGHFEPPVEMAKKFERFLKVKIVEEVEDKQEKMAKGKSEGVTIGDVLSRNS